MARGWRVTVADDRVTDADARGRGRARRRAGRGADGRIARARSSAGVELVAPSPGLPERHPLFAAAADAGVPVRSELELAYGWEQARPGGPRPMVAVTGTDGKTTTTLMATAMVEASGRRAAAAGNTELPLVEALDRDVDAFVVECSSFRLAFTERFRPEAAVWLNLAPDHQDWHRSMASYEEAKARMWDHQRPADAAIGNADDPIVDGPARRARRAATSRSATGGDYRVDGAELRGPAGAAGERGRRCAAPCPTTSPTRSPRPRACWRRAWRRVDGVAAGLAGVRRRPGTGSSSWPAVGGVEWYDDSKATTPHAAATAIRGFDDVVLLAGGRNKGLDLGAAGRGGDARPRRRRPRRGRRRGREGVRTPPLPSCRSRRPGSMADAVEVARGLARAGDTVLLSPACASFDWYSSYGERGDDFARLVHELQGVEAMTGTTTHIGVRPRALEKDKLKARAPPPGGDGHQGPRGAGRRTPPPTSFYVLLVAVFVLCMLGLVMVLSASSIDALRQGSSGWTYFGRQALWASARRGDAARRLPRSRTASCASLVRPGLLIVFARQHRRPRARARGARSTGRGPGSTSVRSASSPPSC